MPPTQLSPTTTFQGSFAQSPNLYGLLDSLSPTGSTFAGTSTQPSSAFPYFYSIPDDGIDGSVIGVSNNIFILLLFIKFIGIVLSFSETLLILI